MNKLIVTAILHTQPVEVMQHRSRAILDLMEFRLRALLEAVEQRHQLRVLHRHLEGVVEESKYQFLLCPRLLQLRRLMHLLQ